MNIKQFAMKTGLTARAIRFYEEKGILRSKRDKENQYRIFDSDQVEVARRIAHFRQLGFSVSDIASMLATSPNLTVASVNKNIQTNLKKLYREKAETEKRIQQTEALLNATNDEQSLSSGQKEMFQALAYTNLQDWSLNYVQSCLKRKAIGPDEQLQMIACAYADLVLRHQMGASKLDYAKSHQLISKVLKRVNEEHLGKRHELLAKAYENLHRDPNWLDLKP